MPLTGKGHKPTIKADYGLVVRHTFRAVECRRRNLAYGSRNLAKTYRIEGRYLNIGFLALLNVTDILRRYLHFSNDFSIKRNDAGNEFARLQHLSDRLWNEFL